MLALSELRTATPEAFSILVSLSSSDGSRKLSSASNSPTVMTSTTSQASHKGEGSNKYQNELGTFEVNSTIRCLNSE